MAERIQKTKAVPAKQEKAVEEVEATVDAEADKLKAEADALLDEIDAELAENDAMADLWADIDEALGENIEQASDFIRNYIQKGGQLCETLWYNVKSRNQRMVLRLRGLHEGMQSIRL